MVLSGGDKPRPYMNSDCVVLGRRNPSNNPLSPSRKALTESCRHRDFRVTNFSVMSNHVHLICEADGRRALAKGLQGLFIRMAKGLNWYMKRRG